MDGTRVAASRRHVHTNTPHGQDSIKVLILYQLEYQLDIDILHLQCQLRRIVWTLAMACVLVSCLSART